MATFCGIIAPLEHGSWGEVGLWGREIDLRSLSSLFVSSSIADESVPL